jgi:hypothetical protein
MADVFLSYKSDDLPKVRPLIDALEQHGLSVWWDRKIAPGKKYPQVIKEKLKASKAVVVVWSEASVESEWVQIEATQGKRRGILVPLMIDPVEDDIPLEFSLIEAADLTDWDGVSSHHELDALLGSVGDILSASQAIAPSAEPGEVARFIHDRARVTRRGSTDIPSRAEGAWKPSSGRSRIYLSYRRADARGRAAALYDSLTNAFGSDLVFMDIDAIQVGIDFHSAIESAIASAGAVIAIIGRHWLTETDESGKRRLDNPADFVRMELAAALRSGIPVIPVLVDGAQMPSADELPSDIAVLTRRQALEISDVRWRGDVDRFIRSLESLVP